MTKLFAGLSLAVSMASAASAKMLVHPQGGYPAVPEIDALAGTAALATVSAALALLWERRRRRK